MAQPPPDPIHILHCPSGAVHYVLFMNLNDGNERQLVSGSDSGFITVWNLKTLRPEKNWKAHDNPVLWLGIVRADRTYLVSQGRGECVKFWSPEGNHLKSISYDHEGFCKCDVREDKIAIPSSRSGIRVCSSKDVSNIAELYSLNLEKEGAIMAIKITSASIIAASESGCISLHSESVLKNQCRVEGMPTCIAENLKYREILIGSSSEKIFILDEHLNHKREVVLTNPGLNFIAVRPDGKIYASAGWDHRLRIFGAKSHKKLCVLQLHDESLSCVAFTTDHLPNLLAAGSRDALISLWDIYN